MPRASNRAAREAEAMPLPSEDTTPPVINTYLVINSLLAVGLGHKGRHNHTVKYWRAARTIVLVFDPGFNGRGKLSAGDKSRYRADLIWHDTVHRH